MNAPSPLKWRLALACYLPLLAYQVSLSPRYLRWWMIPAPVDGKLNPFTYAPTSTSLTDIAANLAAFFMLGLLGALSVPEARTAARVLLLTALLGCGLSAGVEYVQQWIPGRVSSGMDIVFDTLGTVLGGLVAHQLRDRLERWVASSVTAPSGVGWPAVCYLAVIVTVSMWPWQLGVSVGELAHGLAEAELSPLSLPAGGTRAVALEVARTAPLFVPLGVLAARHARGALRLGRFFALAVCVAGGIEVMQLISSDHVCSVWQVGAGALGALGGAWAGRTVWRGGGRASS